MEIWGKLSNRLKLYREKQNLSQSAYSAELGVAKSTLQKLERGEAVAPQTLSYVLDQLGMELVLRSKVTKDDRDKTVEAIEKLIAAAREVQELLEAEEWN